MAVPRLPAMLRGHRYGVRAVALGAVVDGDDCPFSLHVVREVLIRDGLFVSASMTVTGLNSPEIGRSSLV